MGFFSSLFGGGGAAQRAAQAAAEKEAAAADLSRKQYEASQKAINDQNANSQASIAAEQARQQEAIRQQQAQAAAAVNQRYGEVSQYYQPYQQAGTAALGQYQNIAGTLPGYTSKINTLSDSMSPIVGKITSDNLNDYQSSPGYDFRFQQGQRALEASRAAGGNLNSGATGKALLEYGQGIGSAEYQNYLGNLYNQLGAVNTQIGGVQAGQQSAMGSLDAYGNLINTGANAANANAQLGMNAAQYNAGQGANAAQFGASLGMSAEQLKAALGSNASQFNAQLGAGSASEQGQRLANMGSLYGQGILMKDQQMKAAGDQWLNLAAAAATGGASMGMSGGGPFNTAGAGYGGGSNMASIQPYYGSSNISGMQSLGSYFTPQQTAAPWVNPDAMMYGPQQSGSNPQQQAQLGTQTSYQQRRPIYA